MMKTQLKGAAAFAPALRAFARALLVVVGASAVFSLSACSFLLPSIGNTLNSELRPHESDGTAVVDFDEVFLGEWTELVFICRGATREEMEATLGFEWPDSPNLESPGFHSVIVLSDGKSVIEYFDVGQNDFEEDLYVVPCTPSIYVSGGARSEGQNTVSIAREASQLEFVFNPPPQELWYVSETEFERLRNGN